MFVALHNDWLPLEALSERGVYKGITVDVLEDLAHLLNINFTYSAFTGDVKTETADIIPSIQDKTKLKNTNYLVLPAPHFTFPYAIFTARDNKSINGLNDLAYKRVAIFKYAKINDYLLAQVPNIEIVKVDIAEDAFALLKHKQIDAYVGNATVVKYNAYIIGFHDLKQVATIPENIYVSMAVKKDQVTLQRILQKALNVNFLRHQRIINNWEVNKPNELLNMLYVVMAIGLLFLVYLFAKSQRLKQSIKTQNQQAQAIIWQQANYDFLTQLPNRFMFHNHLTKLMTETTVNQRTLHFFLIDLDQFKHVNEYYGHQIGDQILVEIAVRLNQCLPENAICARLGGDEFALLVEHIQDQSAVTQLAEQILSTLAKPYLIEQHGIIVTASIGITFYPNDAHTAENLYQYSDQAMQEAKRLGRNRHQIFTESMWLDNLQRSEMSEDIHSAISNKQFVLFYQPIVDLRSDAIYKAEALIRWQHPKYGLITPDKFISVAESNGTIHQIGDWVFQQAFETAASLRAQCHPHFSINVNVSPIQFQYKQNLRSWMSHIGTDGSEGNMIGVEITESLLLDPSEEIKTILKGFQQAGSKISIDDFGTGYSSLSYLRKFNIDYIKIDKTFVSNIDTNSHDLALCEAIIQMSHKLGIHVVAEGVETEAQLRLLKDADCDYAQGYLFSKPVPLDALKCYLNKR